MPPRYELIGYNIPQLCAWKLGFSPLNTRTTSAGKTIRGLRVPPTPPIPRCRRRGGRPGMRGGSAGAATRVGAAPLSGLDAENPRKEPPKSFGVGKAENDNNLIFFFPDSPLKTF